MDLSKLPGLKRFFGRKDCEPFADEKTFFLWEPCSGSHGEVLPGYAKYLLDLGFEVSVMINSHPHNQGLFSRFRHDKLHLNEWPRKRIFQYFMQNGLGSGRGIMLTSARKLIHYRKFMTRFDRNYDYDREVFARNLNGRKILLVEHDVQIPADMNIVTPDIITLRKVDYCDVVTTPVNPHYFGEVKHYPKNLDVVNFVLVGGLRAKRRNHSLLLDAVKTLQKKGIDNFKITVIGKGDLSGMAPEIRRFFEVKGRLDFARMYDEIERADFFLTLLDVENTSHERYITTGTSGAFQLIYGFAKPCLIAEKFTFINGFTPENSIIYRQNSDLALAMEQSIQLDRTEYDRMRNALIDDAAQVYRDSLDNLKRLIYE